MDRVTSPVWVVRQPLRLAGGGAARAHRADGGRVFHHTGARLVPWREGPASAFDDFQGAMALAWILQQSGEVEHARGLAADTRLRYQKRLGNRTRRPEDFVDLARIMVLEGDPEGALRQIEDGVRHGWRFHHDRIDFILNSLRGEPRYDRLMAEVKADVDRMRERVEREGW